MVTRCLPVKTGLPIRASSVGACKNLHAMTLRVRLQWVLQRLGHVHQHCGRVCNGFGNLVLGWPRASWAVPALSPHARRAAAGGGDEDLWSGNDMSCEIVGKHKSESPTTQ